MKLTTKPVGKGMQTNVMDGRKIVGRIDYDEILDRFMPSIRVPNEGGKMIDGARWHWRVLANARTAQDAFDAIRATLMPATTAPVTDRIVVMGCGLSQKKTDELAAAIRKRL